MKPDEAARIAEQFLEKYMLADEYFKKRTAAGEEVERIIHVQYVAGSDQKIEIAFAMESEDLDEPDDPEVVALVEKAIAALKAAHPEIQPFTLTHSFVP